MRSENVRVDLLSKLATLDYLNLHKMTYLKVLDGPSIEEESTSILQIDNKPSWMDMLVKYVPDGKLQEE